MNANDKKITLIDIETGENEYVSLSEYKDIHSDKYPWIMFFLSDSNDICVANYESEDVNTLVESINLLTGELMDIQSFALYMRVMAKTFELDGDNIHILAVKEKEYTEFIRKDYKSWSKFNGNKEVKV